VVEEYRITKWEYQQLGIRSNPMSLSGKDRKQFVADLNRLGQEGWEIVGSYASLGTTQYYLLKRPRRE
jgi:hypothetical protein